VKIARLNFSPFFMYEYVKKKKKIVITRLGHKILKYSCVEDQNVIGDVCWYEQAVEDSWRLASNMKR
jgi:hypothetical protein